MRQRDRAGRAYGAKSDRDVVEEYGGYAGGRDHADGGGLFALAGMNALGRDLLIVGSDSRRSPIPHD
jgi:hypothetical protein